MAQAIKALKKALLVVLIVGVVMMLLAAPSVQGARLLGGSKSLASGMEMDDLSLEQQQQVMDLSQRLDGATRQLLTQDPYHTY